MNFKPKAVGDGDKSMFHPPYDKKCLDLRSFRIAVTILGLRPFRIMLGLCHDPDPPL